MKRIMCTAATVLVFSFAASAATIRTDPLTSATSVGGTVDVNVHIADVADLYGYQFDVAYVLPISISFVFLRIFSIIYNLSANFCCLMTDRLQNERKKSSRTARAVPVPNLIFAPCFFLLRREANEGCTAVYQLAFRETALFEEAIQGGSR